MISLQRRVPPPLDGFIEFLWYWESDQPGHAKDAITASCEPSIQIDLTTDKSCWYDGDDYARKNMLTGMSICGTRTSPFAIDAFHPRMMGVQFKPGGSYPFFGPAAHEFSGTHVALEDVWGADAQRLQQRLVQAPTPESKLDILEAALLSAARREFAHHPAVALALWRFEQRPHRVSVAATAREAEICQKKFIQLFREEVGLTPKAYLRVARFQRVMENIIRAPQINWWDVVERHGYFDQPHFIREFRGFTGFTPTEWLKLRGPFVHHIPLPA